MRPPVSITIEVIGREVYVVQPGRDRLADDLDYFAEWNPIVGEWLFWPDIFLHDVWHHVMAGCPGARGEVFSGMLERQWPTAKGRRNPMEASEQAIEAAQAWREYDTHHDRLIATAGHRRPLDAWPAIEGVLDALPPKPGCYTLSLDTDAADHRLELAA